MAGELSATDEVMPALLEWKGEGRLGHVGVTTHRVEQHDGIEACMEKYPLDFIQINYSLGEREAEDRVLPLAQDLGIAVLINRPYQSGRLFRAVSGTAVQVGPQHRPMFLGGQGEELGATLHA